MPYRRPTSWGRQKPPLGYELIAGHPLVTGLNVAWLGNSAGVGESGQCELVGKKRFLVSFNSSGPLVNVSGQGRGLRFPDSTGLLSNTAIKPVAANTPISLFCVARVEDTTGANRKRAVRLFGAAGSSAFIEFSDSSNNLINAGIQTSLGLFPQTAQALDPSPTYSANTDYFLGMRWNGTSTATIDLFVNGVLAKTSPATATSMVASTGFNIGNNTGGSALFLRGTIYCAYQWNRALTNREMALLAMRPYDFIDTPRRRIISQVASSGWGRLLSPSRNRLVYA